MRRRRAIIFGDDHELFKIMTYYFITRGDYEVLSYREPIICPIWADGADCASTTPCADIIISDRDLPKMDGLKLFRAQSQKACKVSQTNKALISRNFNNKLTDIMESGCVYFEEPINLQKFTAWLQNCELHMDLSKQLNIKRKDVRLAVSEIVEGTVQPNNKILSGIAVNKSPSGLCLKAKNPLRQEQTVAIHSEHPDTSRTASVRWTIQLEDSLYLMGLQYL